MMNIREMTEKREGFVRDSAEKEVCSHIMIFIDKVELLKLILT